MIVHAVFVSSQLEPTSHSWPTAAQELTLVIAPVVSAETFEKPSKFLATYSRNRNHT
jgi:hypothetical protein